MHAADSASSVGVVSMRTQVNSRKRSTLVVQLSNKCVTYVSAKLIQIGNCLSDVMCIDCIQGWQKKSICFEDTFVVIHTRCHCILAVNQGWLCTPFRRYALSQS